LPRPRLRLPSSPLCVWREGTRNESRAEVFARVVHLWGCTSQPSRPFHQNKGCTSALEVAPTPRCGEAGRSFMLRRPLHWGISNAT
jgi:hypothetical protein